MSVEAPCRPVGHRVKRGHVTESRREPKCERCDRTAAALVRPSVLPWYVHRPS